MIAWLLPPWASVPLKIAKGVIKSVPWQVWISLALLAAFWVVKTASFNAGVNVTNAEWQARSDKLLAEAERKAREAEHAHANEIDRIAANLIEERNRGYQERDKVISDLRAGAVRVRDRFKCPARNVPNAGTAAAGSHGGTEAGFTDADAEIAFRIAADGDAAVRQLKACQAVIRADRATVNGQK